MTSGLFIARYTVRRRLLPLIDRKNIIMSSFSSTASKTTEFPVTSSIKTKLQNSFQPVHLEILNESHMHNVPLNSETHFKVVIVADKFGEVKTPIQRHRLVNSALAEELAGPVHALSIIAKTPQQWGKMVKEASGGGSVKIPPSPSCRGGDGSLPTRKS
uniref:BolA-like protein n=1 Tax=Eucampia antarctica TaxID=49252 RepID=A0A7S2W6G2_9STRA|mmetsp:Transcript_21777/g.20912  ORF Transcript_21777/g.20912 Transcript_21777/m.20912 type:complete len:159 (+) Transcript_21777:42-518(+)|eukprot:CAMPEP_0197836992 /NCGR_PEP_ID=MMETSP1437-20131217/30727_1 /TAXON_ID=49252 ORGANISM="Eucampia antarctica, Strain CCMP1452" /NCGR_SAMPLE_ID=MMETSP1437 /ASSEMBLY_ACC=CAM_ASM_001096 /LENGTH=158 /DNA_ID=CAMNT_0043443643 /DNA_START=42 /DNA_END=518 /DNA_ORIENTATION=-